MATSATGRSTGNVSRPLQLDLRHDLEHCAVLEIALADVDRLDARAAGGRELFLLDRLGKARLHYVAEHFLAHLLAELLAHDFHRHLTGPDPFQTHGAAQPLQPLIHHLIDLDGGHLDFHPALERAGRWLSDGRLPSALIALPLTWCWANLHGLRSWSRRCTSWPAGSGCSSGPSGWQPFVVGAGCLVAGAVTPVGPKLLLAPLLISSSTGEITEWQHTALYSPVAWGLAGCLLILLAAWSRPAVRVHLQGPWSSRSSSRGSG